VYIFDTIPLAKRNIFALVKKPLMCFAARAVFLVYKVIKSTPILYQSRYKVSRTPVTPAKGFCIIQVAKRIAMPWDLPLISPKM